MEIKFNGKIIFCKGRPRFYLSPFRPKHSRNIKVISELAMDADHFYESREVIMGAQWEIALWQQFGATIDMLGNAARACPDSKPIICSA